MADEKKGAKGRKRDKRFEKKRRLAKANRKNRRIPAFVIIRTKRRVQNNRYRREWRTDKLRIPEE